MGEGSASRPGRNLLSGKTRYPLYRRLGGPQGRSVQVRKTSPPPGFDPRTVQPLGSRYTDWATRPTQISVNTHKIRKCHKIILCFISRRPVKSELSINFSVTCWLHKYLCLWTHPPAIYLSTLCVTQRFSEDLLVIISEGHGEIRARFNFSYSHVVYKNGLRKITIKLS